MKKTMRKTKMRIKAAMQNRRNAPSPFADWAKPAVKHLNDKRAKTLCPDCSVLWDIGKENGACSDHMEMSGFRSSSIVCAGKDRKGHLLLHRHITVPGLRTVPNDTRGSFAFSVSGGVCRILIDSKTQTEYPEKVIMRGNLKIISESKCCEITRKFINCADAPGLIEKINIKMKSSGKAEIYVPSALKTLPEKYCAGSEINYGVSACRENSVSFVRAYDFKTKRNMTAGEEYSFCIVYFAGEENTVIDADRQIKMRNGFINDMFTSTALKSGNRFLDAEFSHCMLRACESIFKTKSGLFHSPGGGNYYAALWTNDQCEYANPLFPFTGYGAGIESALNCYRLYEKYMDKSDTPFKDKRALVTSIVAEGDGFWNGAGDRGDGAMYAYGICRFLLALGEKPLFEEFFGSIKWCLDFCLSRKNESGVISSDSDELENRFESSNANLNTSCLTYDALLNGAVICDLLGKNKTAEFWRGEAQELRKNIEKYFGARVEGFNTYAYYKGNTLLRSWICTPLTVEIFTRKDETLKALFSPALYKDGMLRSESGNGTTWDRSLLFALRGAFLADYETAFEKICAYSENRLTGNHSPYPFEAYPEGNRAHLSGESALFCRAVTEGMFGLRVTGYKKLRIAPKRQNISLTGICVFGEKADIYAEPEKIVIRTDGKEFSCQAKSAEFDFNAHEFIL